MSPRVTEGECGESMSLDELHCLPNPWAWYARVLSASAAPIAFVLLSAAAKKERLPQKSRPRQPSTTGRELGIFGSLSIMVRLGGL